MVRKRTGLRNARQPSLPAGQGRWLLRSMPPRWARARTALVHAAAPDWDLPGRDGLDSPRIYTTQCSTDSPALPQLERAPHQGRSACRILLAQQLLGLCHHVLGGDAKLLVQGGAGC